MFRLIALAAFLLSFPFQSNAQDIQYDHTIDIFKQQETRTSHEAHDIYIFNDNGKYKIQFYLKKGKKLDPRGASVVSEESYNKASYIWESKKRVAIRLFDTNSANDFELKVWGDKKGTSMMVDDDEWKKNMATVYGNITNPKGNKVYLKYYKDYLTYDEAIADSAEIDRNGNFSMEFKWKKPYPATFYHGDEITEMFLAPKDSVQITLDTKEFDETVKYIGQGAIVNNYLAQKTLLFPRQGGSVFKLQEREFTYKIDSLHKEELNYFKDYFSKFPVKEASVIAFMETEEANINYNWANNKIFYPGYHAYLNKQPGPLPVSDTYYDFLKETTAYNPTAVQSTAYLEFVSEYVDKEVEKLRLQDTMKTFIELKVQFIENNLSRDLKDYIMSQWIYNMLTEYDEIENAEQLLNQYKSQTGQKKYIDILDKTLLVASQLSPGNPAPEFSYPDVNDNLVSLNDFKGKIVYMDIWASWCGPCIREIPFAQKLVEEMKDHDVVFLFVSIDADPEAWKKMLKQKELKGVHLISKGNFDADISRLYNVNGIPHYIIIDKEGKIADSNADSPSGEVKWDLEELLKK